jgi:hypothetical protein
MKKIFLASLIGFSSVVAHAQLANRYIVKTKGVQVAIEEASSDSTQLAQKDPSDAPQDFIGKNFKFYSLCDWKEGMRFMVMPDKYDLIVKTFCDAETNKEVSSMTLRYKIMEYKGHSTTEDGHARIHFLCQDNGKNYYYEIPYGSFEDYCYAKTGVPTLAYLDDVDTARKILLNKRLFTKTTSYFIDTNQGEGFEEISVPSQTEVTVVKIGVGTRSFPVKLIVEDKEGNQFFQNIALSKTNSGMTDNNFELFDNLHHTFYGSFQLIDDMTMLGKMSDYVGKTIHTKVAMKLLNDRSQKMQGVPPLIGFIVQEARSVTGKPDHYQLRLKNEITDGIFFKEVSFVQESDNVAEGYKSDDHDFFGNLFALGSGRMIDTSQGSRAMINVGHVSQGFTEDEVMLAVGVPEKVQEGKNGQYDWIYQRSNNQYLHVTFSSARTVLKTSVDKSRAKGAVRRR